MVKFSMLIVSLMSSSHNNQMISMIQITQYFNSCSNPISIKNHFMFNLEEIKINYYSIQNNHLNCNFY